jgi:type III secretory pathway component EscT
MPYIEFHRWILAAVLAMTRIGGAFAVCPALTESMIPGIARRAAVLGFSCLVIPLVKDGMPPGEPNYWMFSFLAVKEAVIGFIIGYFAAVPFWIAENVGNFIDNQRGATMGEVYSPLSGAQVSTTGIFFTQLVSTIFFVGGAVLSQMMGIAFLALGVIEVIAGIQVGKAANISPVPMVISGVLRAICGVMFFMWPASFGIFVAVFTVFRGISLICEGAMGRR